MALLDQMSSLPLATRTHLFATSTEEVLFKRPKSSFNLVIGGDARNCRVRDKLTEHAAYRGVDPGLRNIEAVLSSTCGATKAERINQRCARSPDAAGESRSRLRNRSQQ